MTIKLKSFTLKINFISQLKVLFVRKKVVFESQTQLVFGIVGRVGCYRKASVLDKLGMRLKEHFLQIAPLVGRQSWFEIIWFDLLHIRFR